MLKLSVLTLQLLWELNSRGNSNSSSSLPSHLPLLPVSIHCGAAEGCQYSSLIPAQPRDAPARRCFRFPGGPIALPPVADAPPMRAGPRLATGRKRRRWRKMRSRRTLEDCSSSSSGPKALRIHAESDTEGCERLSERAGRGVFVCARVRTKGARVSSCMCVLAV